MNNLYAPNLSGVDPQTARLIRDLVDRTNYLTTEVDRLRGEFPNNLKGLARRETPQKGIIRVPSIGGDGLIRVNEDGVIVSYVNPVDDIFPYVDLSTVGNVGAGLDVLHTFQLPANSLANDGDYIEAWYAGSFASNDTNKRVNLFFDGTAYENTGTLDIDGGQWHAMSRITRVTSTSVRTSHFMTYFALHIDSANVVTAFGTGHFHVTRSGSFTVGNLNTTELVMEVRGEGGANDDVTQNLSIINRFKTKTVKLV